MQNGPPGHQKIRFRRHEITDLASLPSAAEAGAGLTGSWRRRRVGKAALVVLGGLILLPLLAIGALLAVGSFGVGSERLRVEAIRAIEAAAGPGVEASAGPVRLTFDPAQLLALEVRDVGLRDDTGADLLKASFLRFGLRVVPLLFGEVRLSTAELLDARIVPGQGRGPDWSRSIRTREGLLEPSRVSESVFATLHSMLDFMELGSTETVRLANVGFSLGTGGGVDEIRVAEAMLSTPGPGRLELSSRTEVDGSPFEIEASVVREAPSRRLSDIAVTIRTSEAPATGATRLGGAEFLLTGAEATDSEPSRLTAGLTLGGAALDLGGGGGIEGDVDLRATLVGGSNKLDIERLDLAVGRSLLKFRGAVGPRPPTGEEGDRPAYRFDLISARSLIAPEDSPEPALDAYVRLTGVYLNEERNLTVDELVINSGRGEVLGSLSLALADGLAPGIAAAFSVHEMPVAEVKQLWPWFSARGARKWVLDNLFGGSVADGRVEYQVAPGRLGNGVPLSAEEVSGTFSVAGTRFDTAGLMPPVRDAIGTVDFRGNEVDIALSSGMVFLPSGRTVAASNGTMSIRNANVPPVIGKLDIDVAGDAPAVAELASYEPIDAMRLIGLSPDDFSGQVSGNVKADIPLQKGIDARSLGWLVALDYSGLSIAKPIDEQMVTEAQGTITVDPGRAVVAANAKLSGIAAEIRAVEPLGQSTTGRERVVKLVLDDAARETIAPGIADLVKGKVPVVLDIRDGKRTVAADLTSAELKIPWAGWTKGRGIAAEASFALDTSDGTSRISDFRLSGQSFGAEGTITLSGGSLEAANFSGVRLNRGDDVAVSVKRRSGGYTVDVKGSSLDARSVVKLFMGSSDEAGEEEGESGNVTITADVKTMTGFHGERLSNVRLDYSGDRDRVNGLDVTAVTSSGQRVQIRHGSDGGRRTMRMQSTDAGALLRFMDIYQHMEGGDIELSLSGAADGPMTGRVDARDFWIVNEPRLASLVSSPPPGDRMSLNEAVKRDIDTSRVRFERGFTEIDRGAGYLRLGNGVLRGPLLGFIFQGTLYDRAGRMNMTGTFMPAYGLNRIFGEIPLLGVLLGNGRDRGLIGVTFRLEGDAHDPNLQINPLSVIAPGIFRSIFEFR